MNLANTARRLRDLALELGADEVKVGISSSVSSEMGQREGRIEESKQARSLSAGFRLLVDDRYSSHGTSDLRPEALKPFLTNAIDATRYLEQDTHRRLPDISVMGMVNPGLLDAEDPTWSSILPKHRREHLGKLEEAILSFGKDAPIRSVTVHVWDGRTESYTVTSNGHEAGWARTSMGFGGAVTLAEDTGRLPEAYDYRSSNHQAELPSIATVAKNVVKRGNQRLNSSAVASRRMPMLLENRVAGKILGMALSPLGGTAIYEERSCLRGKLGIKIGASSLTVLDDPLIPRGLGSRPYDGDGRPSKPMAILTNGVLNTYFINTYNSRRLQMPVTTGSGSNIIVPPSTSSPMDLLNDLPQCIRVEGFLGGNANPVTGDFSYGISGTLFENGEPIQAVSEMNISGNLGSLLESFCTAADDVYHYSSYRVPSLLFDNVQFSGT